MKDLKRSQEMETPEVGGEKLTHLMAGKIRNIPKGTQMEFGGQ
jgi:hypothetical protein